MSEPMTLLKPTADEDEYGNPTVDFDTPTEVEFSGMFEPRDSAESGTGEAPRQVARIYAPADLDVDEVDRIEARGKVWAVTGPAAVWSGGFGPLGGTVIDVTFLAGVEVGS